MQIGAAYTADDRLDQDFARPETALRGHDIIDADVSFVVKSHGFHWAVSLLVDAGARARSSAERRAPVRLTAPDSFSTILPRVNNFR